MSPTRSAALLAALALSLSTIPLAAQPPAGMGMGRGMMGMGRDSATMALMQVVHELVMNHDRITRTVTNLPDGVRTLTQSDDPRLARLIREHVVTSGQRVARGDDPGLPMESPALREVFRNGAKIRATTQPTAKGIIVVETSDDSATVAALQKHASEVTELVNGGMNALHESMMRNGGMMGGMRGAMIPGMHGGPPSPAGGNAAGLAARRDSTFAALQQRGREAMGVDQYTSTHQFDALPDGGRIELQRDVDDSAGVAQIRAHLQEIAKAFAAGDFDTPAFVHLREVPGASVMAAKRAVIRYTYRDLPRGGELRIATTDPAAIVAIHEFMAFQRKDHRAGGMSHDSSGHGATAPADSSHAAVKHP